jgi:hypothetical protein
MNFLYSKEITIYKVAENNNHIGITSSGNIHQHGIYEQERNVFEERIKDKDSEIKFLRDLLATKKP